MSRRSKIEPDERSAVAKLSRAPNRSIPVSRYSEKWCDRSAFRPHLICTGNFTTKRSATHADPGHVRAPDLVGRDFTAAGPNRKWVTDFTYCSTWSGITRGPMCFGYT